MQRSRAAGSEMPRLAIVAGDERALPPRGARDERVAAGDSHNGTPAWLRAAGRPAFEELRNVLLVLGLRLSSARSYITGLKPAANDAVDPVADPGPFHAARRDIDEAVQEIESGVDVLRDTLLAIEELVVAPHRSTRLVEIVAIAEQLAHHHTRPAGGVRWQTIGGDAKIDVTRSAAIGVLSTAFSLLALRVAQGSHPRPIDVVCDRGHLACEVWLGSQALFESDVEMCAVALERMFGDDAKVAISVRRANLVIELARAA